MAHILHGAAPTQEGYLIVRPSDLYLSRVAACGQTAPHCDFFHNCLRPDIYPFQLIQGGDHGRGRNFL